MDLAALRGRAGRRRRAVPRRADDETDRADRLAGFAFAVLDETTQPLFERQFDWWDLWADWLGVLIACGTILVLERLSWRFGASLR